MPLYRDEAVVLRTYRFGEADRVVVLMTRRHGKVRAVAKGVRRTGSKFGSRLEPGSHVQAQLHEGRGELHLVTQVETVTAHPRTREDLARLGHAAALLEAVDQLAQDHEPNARLHTMLVGGLGTVEESDPPMVVGAFYLKLLAAEGVAPALDACVVCGEPLVAAYWAPEAGGVRCGSCGGGRPIGDEALAVARAVLGGALTTALEVSTPSVVHEVETMASALLEAHIERHLRAIRVLHD